MNRRKALIHVGGGIIISLLGTRLYLGKENIERLKLRDNKIPADLHVHLSKDSNPKDVKEVLTQGGLVALTTYSGANKLLSYHDVKNYEGFKQIDPGIFGELTYNGNTGYVLNGQEITADHHISALGCKEQISNIKDSIEAVKEVHKQGGIAILEHPYVIPGGITRYRLLNEKEENKLYEICGIIDEVEVFNGQCISLIPYIIDMEKANEKAKKFVDNYFDFKGIVSSDTHLRFEQVLTSGIYISHEDLTFKKLEEIIKGGDFEAVGNRVSKISFLKGHFPWLENII
jgi:hypothetical protein